MEAEKTFEGAGFEKRLDARLVASIVATGALSFCGVLVETAMNIAFPQIIAEFGAASSTVQWITTGYLLMLAIIVPTSAHLDQRFPMRALFGAAVLLFGAGTLLGAFAPSFPMLLAGRLIQGAGTGIAMPLMWNIVYEQVPDERMGTMSGVASFTTSIAPAIGPSLGGILVDAFGWRSIFRVLLPVVALAGIVGLLSIRESHTTGRSRFDAVGWALIAMFAVSLVMAVSGTLSGIVSAVLLGLSMVSVLLYVRHARRSEHALISVDVLHEPAFALAIVAIVLGQAIQLGLNYLIPNYLQVSLGASATLAGNLMISGCLLMAITVPVSGVLYDRFGARVPVLAGSALLAAACLGFGAAGTSGSFAALVVLHSASAMGQASMCVNIRTYGMGALDSGLASDGNALVNTLQQLAGGIGTAVCSSIVATAQSGASDLVSATAAGTAQAGWVMFACSLGVLAASIAALRVCRSASSVEEAPQGSPSGCTADRAHA